MSRRCLYCVVLFVSQIQHVHARDAYQLQILVVDRAQTQPLVLHSAMGQAARLLAAAGVKSSWRMCPASSIPPESQPCAETGSLSLTLRVLPAKEAVAWPVDRNSCGMAIAGALGEHGSLAIIDADCIARRSASRPGAQIALLAHVFAHELGHLLLGRDSHSIGLMSARWTKAELTLLVRDQLAFTDLDAAKLREAMSIRALAPAKSSAPISAR